MTIFDSNHTSPKATLYRVDLKDDEYKNWLRQLRMHPPKGLKIRVSNTAEKFGFNRRS